MNEHQAIETRFYNRIGQTLKTAIEEMGSNYHYRPSRFLTQFNWIEEKFYSTTGSGKANRLYQRMTTEAAVDTNALAIKATLMQSSANIASASYHQQVAQGFYPMTLIRSPP